MPYKIVSIFIFLLSLPLSGRIIDWATDANRSYLNSDIIILNGVSYIASVTGNQSPLEKPSNFQNIQQQYEDLGLDNVVIGASPELNSTRIEELLSEALDLSAQDINGIQSGGLVSLSVRGEVGSNDNIRIMGFVLSSGVQVLMRGLGPVLSTYGLEENSLLPDPQISLHKYSDPDNPESSFPQDEGNNDNSDVNDPNITAAVNNSVPIVEIKEKQAISLSSLESGFYTMHLKDPSGKKGIGVSAVDLVDPTSSFFTHLSSRGVVSDNEYMFGSFRIIGKTVRVLIRGRGPSLADDNVTNPMTNPYIELWKYNQDPSDDLVKNPPEKIYFNDDYRIDNGNDDLIAEIQNLSSNIYGGPALQEKEAALLISLVPGYYSAQLHPGKNDDGKNGWIGIDDVTD